jgi:FtsH-binding integral membrane protein
MLLCLIPAFGGVFLSKADSPVLSLIGGVACAVGLGLYSGPYIASYKIGSIVNVAAYTAGITLCMTVAASVFRNALAGIGGALFGALTMLVFSDFVALFMAMMGFNVAPAVTFLDCFAVVLFSIYIAYDMMLLDTEARTADDAIDMSVHVFLDIINIFLSLLSLLGDKDD